MVYYCDYEALEFNNEKAIQEKIYPYYLDNTLTETSLCPIFFSACTEKSVVVSRQNVYKKPVSFLRFLEREIIKYKHLPDEQKTLFCWFHNVKYDFRIIVHELFYNDFINIVDSEQITYIGEYQTEKEKAFAIVGENLAKYIGVNMYYKGFKIMIRDTMSILNSAQDAILEEFGFPKKVEIEWNDITIENLKAHMTSIEERNVYDVTSLAECIEKFKTTFFEKFHGKGTTASGMSLNALKYYLCKNAGMETTDRDSMNDFFRECYPMIEGLARDLSIGCYHGGICTLNTNYAGTVLENVQMIDINSSYPNSMTQPLPYGNGKQIKEFTNDGYSEYVVYVEFEHKGIPFQRCHSENRARQILGLEPKNKIYTRSQFPQKYDGYLCINSIDLETLKRYAKIKRLDFQQGVNYKTNTVIRDFIIPIYDERKHSHGIIKTAIKLLLNSLYGKYAQDLSGIVFQYLTMDEYTKIIAIDNDTLYKPLASAVTAYSRQNLIEKMYMIGDDFLYCDTDSIYFKNVDVNMELFNNSGVIHPDELGKWSTEYDTIHKAKFLSKKNYIIDCTFTKNGKQIRKQKVTCVGLSHKYHEQVTFDNFVINSSPFEIYKMVNIYGGKAMRKTTFEIKERNYY